MNFVPSRSFSSIFAPGSSRSLDPPPMRGDHCTARHDIARFRRSLALFVGARAATVAQNLHPIACRFDQAGGTNGYQESRVQHQG
jgi:hypothetical protein